MRFGNGGAQRSVVCLALGLTAAACDRTPRPDPETVALKAQLEQLTAVSAEKDSLLREVTENTRLMSDISAELVKIERRTKSPAKAESPALKTTLSDRDFVREKIKEVTARVKESEDRLAASQRRVRTLSKESDSLRTSFEATVGELQAVIENQKYAISALSDQLNSLQEENARLAEEKAQLSTANTALIDTLASVVQKDNIVYYAIGTKDELKQKGIVVEEGSKFLFFGHKTLQPARTLHPEAFIAIDKRYVSEVEFPEPGKEYRILSRQNPAFLSSQPDKDGKLKGGLQIASSEEFWAPSRFLILVEQ